MKNCVYRFLDKDNNIIYIGKAKNLKNRLNGHNHLPKECYEERKKTEYVSFKNENDMDFAERYFICKESPKYNEVLSNKPISINVTSLDMISWTNFSNKVEKNVEGGLKDFYFIVSDESRELEKLRAKVEALRDICKKFPSFDRSDKYKMISSELGETIDNAEKIEDKIKRKLIKIGIDEIECKVYIKYNSYNKDKIIRENLKEIENEYLNKCLEQINERGYYKHNTYIGIEEKFFPSVFNENWLIFLKGEWLDKHMLCRKFLVDKNVKDKLVTQIIQNIESKIFGIYGDVQKDIIILKANDHWGNGFYKFEFMERDIPYIIYRVANNY